VRRLDRKIDQTLYLVVESSNGVWSFPADDMPTDENLHQVRKICSTLGFDPLD
jgi:hypothetical protein